MNAPEWYLVKKQLTNGIVRKLFRQVMVEVRMTHGIWELFLTLIGRDGEPDEGEEEKRFVPSPLDLSVRVGHGGRDDEVARELSKISEQAREIEESQRGN